MSTQQYTVREFLLEDATTINPEGDHKGTILGRAQCQFTGKGVCIYRRHADGLVCAMKRLALNQTASFEREISALQVCGSHSNLIEILDFYHDPRDGCLIICETLATGGTLTGLLSEIGRPMTAKEALFYACELFETVNFVHERGILHHDIKEENVFVQSDGHLILGDFGLARPLALGETMPNFWANQSAHMPLEVHSDILNNPQGGFKFQIGHSVDWFSVGVLLYVLLHCQLPFNKPLIPANAPFVLKFSEDACSLLKQLLCGLLRMHQGRRLGGERIFLEPWIQTGVKGLLEKNGRTSMEASDVAWLRQYIRDKQLSPPFLPNAAILSSP